MDCQHHTRLMDDQMRIFTKLFVTAAAVATTFISSTAWPQADVAKALQTTLPRGWECLQGPNDIDKPGRTFYVDRRGVRYDLEDLSPVIHSVAGDISNAVVSSSGDISAGIFAKLIGLGSASVSGSKVYATKVSLSERQEFRTSEPNTRAALRTLDPKLIDPENTYYIIRSSQAAKRMRLAVDKSIAGALGGSVQFNKAVNIGGAARSGATSDKPTNTIVSAQEGEQYVIDQTFARSMTVCFLAQQFTLKSVAGGFGGSVKDAKLLNEFWVPSDTMDLKK